MTHINIVIPRQLSKQLWTPAYTILCSGYWKWIQELCVKFLKKTKAISTYFSTEYSVEYITVDKSKLVSRLLLESSKQLEYSRNYRATIAYIGYQEYRRLMDETKIWQFAEPFYIPPEETNPYTKGTKIYGIEIRVIPWMEGILIV